MPFAIITQPLSASKPDQVFLEHHINIFIISNIYILTHDSVDSAVQDTAIVQCTAFLSFLTVGRRKKMYTYVQEKSDSARNAFATTFSQTPPCNRMPWWAGSFFFPPLHTHHSGGARCCSQPASPEGQLQPRKHTYCACE